MKSGDWKMSNSVDKTIDQGAYDCAKKVKG